MIPEILNPGFIGSRLVTATKTEYFKLSDAQLKCGIITCTLHVQELLEDAQKLISGKNDSPNALGLYYYAIEEYGKALCLRDCISMEPKSPELYNVPKLIFGIRTKGSSTRDSHRIKFERAFKDLPNECKEIPFIYKLMRIMSGASESFLLSNPVQSEVPITVSWSPDLPSKHPHMLYLNVEGKAKTFADAVIKNASFYQNWNDEKKMWEVGLTVKSDLLEGAINKFKEVLGGFKSSLPFKWTLNIVLG